MSRNKTIDIMKGIAIILMVLGHSGFLYERWIYQFHMALFFVVAGFCYNDRYSNNIRGIKELIIKKIKSLYIPCVIWNITITLLHNILVGINFTEGNIYTIKQTLINICKCFLFSGGDHLSGAMWFFRTMFFSIIIYAILDYICNKKLFKHKEKVKWVMCIILLLIGWIGYNLPIGKYFNVFSVIILYQIGYSLKKVNQKTNMKENIIMSILGFLAITIPMSFIKEGISLSSNQIVNPIYFVWCSCGGTLMCYGIANILDKTKISNLISYIGKNTVPIVILHFTTMKLVTLVQILYYNDSIKLLSVHPYLYVNWFWTILYTLTGTVLPLLIDNVYKKIKDIFMSNKLKFAK